MSKVCAAVATPTYDNASDEALARAQKGKI